MTATTARHPDRMIFVLLTAAGLAIPLIGFAPTYYLKYLFNAPPLKTLVLVHAAFYTAWPVLLLGQVVLVRAGNVRLHRSLGWGSLALAAAIVITGVLVIIGRPRPEAFQKEFIFRPLLGLILFAAFFAVAVRRRRYPGTHKRLMLLATLFIIPAGMTRILRFMGADFSVNADYGSYAAYVFVLLPLVLYDFGRLRRIHPATLWGGAVLILRHPLGSLIAPTDTWQQFAAWLTNS